MFQTKSRDDMVLVEEWPEKTLEELQGERWVLPFLELKPEDYEPKG